MAYSLEDYGFAVSPTATAPNTFAWYRFVNGQAPYASPSYANNPTLTTVDPESEDPGDLTSVTGVAAHVSALTGAISIDSGLHTDYHFRMWMIPTLLNLSNPTIGADIPFSMWNTYDQPQDLSAVNVTGSSVLTFDFVATDTIVDFEFKEINMQIAAGESAISATVDFVFPLGTGQLLVVAVVANTFPILPEVPINEVWRWETDVLTNYKGVETRIALMPNPRIHLEFTVNAVGYDERRTLYGLMSSNIKVPSIVPLFQYASPILTTTSIGGTRLYFNPALANVREDGFLVLMNSATRATSLGTVVTVHADGATIDTAVGSEIAADGLWFAVPALSAFIKDDSGLTFGTQAGVFTLSADNLNDLELQRPGATNAPATFDSLPIVEKDFLVKSPERWAYRRELLGADDVGAQAIKSNDTAFVVKRSVKFSVDRTDDDMDYWRELFAAVNGGQKPFLLSTQLPDLTLRVAHVDGAGTVEINEQHYEPTLWPLDAFKRVKVTYTDSTFTYHIISNSVTDILNNTTLSLSPALTVGKTADRFSFLHKVRATDTVSLEHFNNYSYIKFGVRTTNN